MYQDATRYGGRTHPRQLCARWGSSPLHRKGAEPLPNFRPMPIVAKRLDGSRWHLAQRWALVQATLCKIVTQLPSPKRGRSPLPNFRSISIVAKRLDASRYATWYGGRPQPRGLCVRWGPSPPPKFSADVYYSYCDFVSHSRYWFVQVLVFYAFYFYKKFNRTQSVPISILKRIQYGS